MAIQPSNRPVGSSYRIRFEGNLVVQAGQAGPQTDNAAFPPGTSTTPAAGDKVTVRFALADMTALTNTLKRLPLSSYDNDSPDTTAIGDNDWAENVIVQAYEGAATAKIPADKVFSHIDYLLPTWERDTASSGLRQSSEVPVLLLDFYFNAFNGEGESIPENTPIVVDIWLPPSPVR